MSGCWLCISYYLPNPFSLGFSLTGLARGGQQVTKCKEMFVKAIELMIELASLQVRERESGLTKEDVITSLAFSSLDIICDTR